ncbi:LPS-assembly protein LptD [Amylibacter sp. SFDW26]|uniref:LPS-assembly protein LptD n=1 Tax=Amylibacter sp. SFDW26 TaxID=2652722 RepID=UPI001869C019|nr:LPS assembly protein LptD [Amylibacter sp. SFDW26]
MTLKRLSSALLVALLLNSTSTAALAQANNPVGLLADSVDYNARAKVLSATGNVRIVSEGQVLSAKTVLFNEATGRLTIPGGFTITNPDGSILTGTDADLSADLANNIIKGARILIADQFQLAADQAQYKDNRFKVLDRVVASTCYICKSNPIPFWQIRSNRVIHDELEKQLYFEHAKLEFLGVPVLYAPNLRLPDPTVDRASGLLVPSFFTSDLLQFGGKIPYFFAIDDHSDATVTAFFATVGSFVTEVEYRRETRNGSYTLDGSILLVDGLDNNPFRSSLKGEGRFRLPNNFDWGFNIDVASDRTYRAQYGFEDEDSVTAQDRLVSELYLERNTTNSFFNVSTASIQSLRTNEIDAQIPLVLPEVYWRNIRETPFIGGKLALEANSTTLFRSGGNRFTRIGGGLDWQREWSLKNGILFGARGEVDAEYYSLNNFTGFTDDSISRVTPTLSAEIRLPLSKATASAVHVIEPIAQIVWNEDFQTAAPNEDSVQVEFEETNLFSTNRFPGFDQQELGLRANVGVNYTRYDPTGWNISSTVGRIFREQDLGQFSNATGLSGQNSDWVGAVSLSFPNKITLTNRTLFSSEFEISKNETDLSYIYKDLETSINYLQLEEDVVAGASDRRREATLKLDYTPNDNWTYLAEWRHDFVTDSAIEGEFGVVYENECVKVDLSLSLQYAASGTITPTKELGLTVSLVGIGNKARAKRRRHSCAL